MSGHGDTLPVWGNRHAGESRRLPDAAGGPTEPVEPREFCHGVPHGQRKRSGGTPWRDRERETSSVERQQVLQHWVRLTAEREAAEIQALRDQHVTTEEKQQPVGVVPFGDAIDKLEAARATE
jgi:hypothetical protein